MPPEIRVAIVGSRSGFTYETVANFVGQLPPGTIVVSGGAPGVDTFAVQAARNLGLSVEVIPAKWDLYGKAAGPLRNAEIVKRADVVVSFWNGKSRGTRDTMQKAAAADKARCAWNPGDTPFLGAWHVSERVKRMLAPQFAAG